MLLASAPHINQSDKVKIGFARMGEPSWNLTAVLNVMRRLPVISKDMLKDFNWLPCFNTILPQRAPCLDEVIEVKERDYNGFLHLQLSCNSTDEATRKHLFGGAKVLPIEDVIQHLNKTKITNRTITLNFIVMKGIEIDVSKLKKMGLNKEKFCVKLIPLNRTDNAQTHSLETVANYSNYQELIRLRDEFKAMGVPTVMDAIARCEEAGLCCGQTVQEYFNP
jgi:adenine C2-methylase RlmN of 23S rRNA A2503 and tRNA A37